MKNSNIARRNLLGLMAGGIAASTVAVASAIEPPQRPTDEELTRYYAFLWFEMRRLSEEMGVDFLDAFTINRNDDQKTLSAWLAGSHPPSSRCKAVLSAAGLELHLVPSNPRWPKTEAEYDTMIDRIWATST